MRKKRALALFLALALSLGLAVMPAQAARPSGGQTISVAPPPPNPDPFDPADAAAGGKIVLTGANAKIFEQMKAFFIKIANGEQTSTTLTVNTTGLGMDYQWSGYDPDAILYALVWELPFEQYWYNFTKAWKSSAKGDGKYIVSVEYRFPVCVDYVPAGAGTEDCRIDTAKAKNAAAQMKNAQAVVAQNSNRSDYDKLKAYKDYICSQVEYDYDAVEEGNRRAYGDPWQLISVFDNNPNTNVVCAGYAKSFKYLCDLSTFVNDIDCYLVEGETGGPHMWNLLRINGQSYMTDVTGCDGEWGSFGDLFLAGSANATKDGFTIDCPRHDSSIGNYYWSAQTSKYTYLDITKKLYGDLLILSKTDLDPASISQSPQTTPNPGLPTLDVDFASLNIGEIRADSTDDKQYTLGSVKADVSVLVFGSVRSGNTKSAVKAATTELEALGVRSGKVYLMEINNVSNDDIRSYVQENPSYVHVTASSGSNNNSIFWKITRAVDGEGANTDNTVMPAVCVLDSACKPVYFASQKTFDQAKLHSALAPFAGKPFTDVPAWCTKAVNWAVAGQVTTGTSTTAFSPDDDCTHGHILTFLWRAAGEPASSAQAPIPLKGDEWYAGAVRWAAEKGLINADFLVDAPCTRASAVSYIWRAFGSPEAARSSFSDVSPDSSYAAAVDWAVANGITNGTSGGSFSPGDVCSRGQIVTFLHRAYVEEARLAVNS